ncbi:MAG: hypothetical protein IJO76_05220 [Clostridia bacterium]|nr:hypothetical protein [Clostridia bacterium]
MKRVIALLSVAALLLCFSACADMDESFSEVTESVGTDTAVSSSDTSVPTSLDTTDISFADTTDVQTDPSTKETQTKTEGVDSSASTTKMPSTTTTASSKTTTSVKRSSTTTTVQKNTTFKTTNKPATTKTTTVKTTVTTAHRHTYKAASCTEPATCACGATQGVAAGHSFSGGKCSRCGIASPFKDTALEGTDWGYGQVALVGDKVYYTYTYEADQLFFYDGETTRTIPIVGIPNLMISDESHIYYHNQKTSDLYRVNLKTEKCEKFFSAPGLIYEFFKYNDTIYVSADDEEGHEVLYSVGAGTKKSQKILDTDNARMRFAIAEDLFTCFFNDLSVYTIDYKTQKVTKKEDTEVATKEYWLPNTKNVKRFASVVDNSAKDKIIYRARKLLVNGSYYVPVLWHSSAYTGDSSCWVMDTGNLVKILRVDAETGKEQVITDMSAPYWCSGFHVNEQLLVCIIGDTKGGNLYTYRMDPDGGNIRCIGARVNRQPVFGAEAVSAAATLTAMLGTNSKDEGDGGSGSCQTCGGDGRETCNYCGGTGRGKPLYMLGEMVEQGCTYCGSSGWRVCSHCHGYGEE